RLLDPLALDAERFGGLGVVDVGVAEIAGHVAAALELAAAVMPDAIALVVVAVVVEHGIDDRGPCNGTGSTAAAGRRSRSCRRRLRKPRAGPAGRAWRRTPPPGPIPARSVPPKDSSGSMVLPESTSQT